MKKIKKKKTDNFEYVERFIQLIQDNRFKNNTTKYICFDPSIRNVGWCVFNYDDCSIIDFGVISNNHQNDEYGNDPRILKISTEIKRLIYLFNPLFCVVEKITFSKGRFSFSESILLKAVGLITLSIMEEYIPIFEMVNSRAQKILLEKADTRKSNKDLMKKYVMENLPKHLLSNKSIARKIFDTSDAIFIGMAFREACENYLNKHLQWDL